MARILIVEDEKSVAAFLQRALKDAGHTVAVAKDGKDGVAQAKASPPQLVIMDLSMPKLNGWDATRQLKADATAASIPVLALTSAMTATDRDEAYQAGCDAFETKPVDLPRLLARIAELAPG
ncbi:MAG: response regulator [Rhodospirillaceae bacterium]|nr:response regulator [Rhodospirillaceae bacterium]